MQYMPPQGTNYVRTGTEVTDHEDDIVVDLLKHDTDRFF
jgi:hypothetical protein